MTSICTATSVRIFQFKFNPDGSKNGKSIGKHWKGGSQSAIVMSSILLFQNSNFNGLEAKNYVWEQEKS